MMTRLICCTIALLILFQPIHSQTKDTTIQRHTSSIIQFTVQRGDNAVVTVYNMVGAFMSGKTFNQSGSYRLKLDSFHLPAGIYLVQVRTKHNRFVKKAYVLP